MSYQSLTISSSSEPLDLDTLHSRIKELKDINKNSIDENEVSELDSQKLLKDCAVDLEIKLNQILLEFSDISSLSVHDLDAYAEHLKGELSVVKAENDKISNEIEDLKRIYVGDSTQLESDLEGLEYSLISVASQGTEGTKADANLGCSTNEDQRSCQFKILELSNHIENNERTFKSLQDLDSVLKRYEAVEKIEDALTGLKVIEFGGNNIRLSLRTYVPNQEILLSQHNIEDIFDPLEQTHELVLDLVDGTMELNNAEIFPSDVYIGEIIDAAKSFRQLFSPLPLLETRSPLEWFIRKVQDRIVLSILRLLMVKSANKSRHFFEYLERDEIIVAHMVGGVDAFIKVSQGWPVYSSPLRLISLKNSSQLSKEISLSFLCKVEEASNSLDKQIRQNISTFVDAVEEILLQHMRSELQFGDNTREK